MNTAYDLILTRDLNGTEESVGYVIPWSHQDPVQVLRSKPQVNAGTSEANSVGGRMSSRDAPPPYPVEYSNWRGGCGQRSLDWEDSVAKMYWDSRSVDVRKRGNIELGPYRHYWSHPDILGPCIEALGTIWCGFTPGESYPYRALRYWGSGLVALQPDQNGMSVFTGDADPTTWWMAVEDVSAFDVGTIISFPESLYPDIYFTVQTADTVNPDTPAGIVIATIPEGTIPEAHFAAPDVLIHDTWIAVPRSIEDDDDLYVKALCTDGGKVYAAYGDYIIDGEVGYVMSGTQVDGWTDQQSETHFYSGTGNITSLTYSAGYIYGVQTRFGTEGEEKTASGSFGYVATPTPNWGFSAISAAGGVYPETEDVGLATLGNWVYWLVRGDNQGWLYKIQRGGDPAFSLVDTLPHDFNPTCILSHLGYIYIGGYVDAGVTWLNDPEKSRYNGAVYVCVGDTISLLTTVGLDADADYRVCGMQGSERFLHILTQEDLYIWDTQEGALSHVMPVDGGSAEVQGSDGVNWGTDGYDYQVESESVSPNQNNMDANARPNGDGWTTYVQDNANWVRTVTSAKWLNMRIDHNQYGWINRYDAGLSGACTVEFKYRYPENQAGEIWLSDDERHVRVNIRGIMSKKTVHNKVTWTRTGSYVSLGYQSDTAAGSGKPELVQWKRSAKLSTAEHTVRVLLNDSGAFVYIDGKLALQADRASLPFITGSYGQGTGQCVRIVSGWYHNPLSGTTQRNKIQLKYLKYAATGSYPPTYAGYGDVVELGSFAVMNGTIFVPAPGQGMQIAEPTTVAGRGWLETSESAYKMPAVKKTFSSVEIDLPVTNDFIGAVNQNQRILTTVYIDGKPVTLDPIIGPQGNTTHFVLPITGSTTKGYKVSVRVELQDGVWSNGDTVFTPTVNREAATRLRISCITVKFFINGGARQYKIKLDLTGAAEVRDTIPRSYDEDPQAAIDFLFDNTGEILTMDMIGRENYLVHLDETDLRQMTPDKKGYLGIRGYCTIILTEVDPTNVELLDAEAEEVG